MNNGEHTIIEDVIDNNFRIKWKVSSHYVTFDVYKTEITIADQLYFELIDAIRLPDDTTTDIDKAEKYVHGSIKWDGCCEITQEQKHWCGPYDFKLHIKLVEFLYRKAEALMPDTMLNCWDD